MALFRSLLQNGELISMARMLNRSRYSPCGCHTCRDSTPHANGQNRLREEREWREDVRELPQGQAWLDEIFEAEGLSDLPYWEAVDRFEAMYDGPDVLPPGFAGTWSTEGAHTVLMAKADKLRSLHKSLSRMELVERGRAIYEARQAA